MFKEPLTNPLCAMTPVTPPNRSALTLAAFGTSAAEEAAGWDTAMTSALIGKQAGRDRRGNGRGHGRFAERFEEAVVLERYTLALGVPAYSHSDRWVGAGGPWGGAWVGAREICWSQDV
jgi:hypothetical protein